MTIDELKRLLREKEAEGYGAIEYTHDCHDCGKETTVRAANIDGEIIIQGGAIYKPESDPRFFLKCEKCYEKDSVLRRYRKCEVYSRIVGYLRPVQNWNDGKQAEFKKRKMMKI